MTDPTAATPVVQSRRVDWIELFFDLAMVAFITQLAHGMHGSPGPAEFLTFLAWSVPAWWAWTNVVACVNVLPVLPARPLAIALLAAMGAIGLMAASVTETTERAWAFALANALLRLVLLVLWIYRAKSAGHSPFLSVLYNGATAVIWAASIFVPSPLNLVLWGIAILVEVLLLRLRNRQLATTIRVDIGHASERLGLFMIILMGESVLSLVTALSAHWNPASGLAALVGFVAIALIAWGFFVAGAGVVEEGLAQLEDAHNTSALLDTVMFLPYLIVISVTMFSAGLATTVSHPGEPLAPGAAITLCGGLALFYWTNAIVMRRYGRPWARLLPWAVPAAVLPVAIAFGAAGVTATVALGLVAGTVILVLGVSIVSHPRVYRGA
ncbi:MAG: low temperature requirement protein A [Microbacteriaceae bacterium]